MLNVIKYKENGKSKPQKDIISPQIELLSKIQITNADMDIEERKSLHTVSGKVHFCSHYEKQDGVSSRSNLFNSGYISKKLK